MLSKTLLKIIGGVIRYNDTGKSYDNMHLSIWVGSVRTNNFSVQRQEQSEFLTASTYNYLGGADLWGVIATGCNLENLDIFLPWSLHAWDEAFYHTSLNSLGIEGRVWCCIFQRFFLWKRLARTLPVRIYNYYGIDYRWQNTEFWFFYIYKYVCTCVNIHIYLDTVILYRNMLFIYIYTHAYVCI